MGCNIQIMTCFYSVKVPRLSYFRDILYLSIIDP